MIFLPGCSCCGGCTPCERCTRPCLTATFSGFEDAGAACDECASLNGAHTLLRGEGKQPSVTLTVTATTGSGASLTANLDWLQSGAYSIGSVTINNGGDGYSGDASITVAITNGVVACDDPPTFEIQVERTQPTLDVNDIQGLSPPGSGADLEPVYIPVNTVTGEETWGLDSVTVTSGGSGYVDGDIIDIKLIKGVEIAPASASIRIDHAQPVVDEFTIATAGGSGAVLTPTWSIDQDIQDFYDGLNAGYDGRYWYISGITITNGGTGYQALDEITYTLTGLNQTWSNVSPPFLLGAVSAVNGSGQITAIDLDATPAHFKTAGTIQSVFVDDTGEYYSPGGIKTVTVKDGGTIWPNSTCTYSVCEPTTCEYDGKAKCRKISLTIGKSEHHLTVTLDNESPALVDATLAADGTPCDELEFAGESITSECPTVGTISISPAECSSPPSVDSCCTDGSACSGPCEADGDCGDGCFCCDGQCEEIGCCCIDLPFEAGGAKLYSFLNGFRVTKKWCEVCGVGYEDANLRVFGTWVPGCTADNGTASDDCTTQDWREFTAPLPECDTPCSGNPLP